MHRLSRFFGSRKAQEQANNAAKDAPGNRISGETNGAINGTTNSHDPAQSQTNGASPESTVDVSVMIKPLPATPTYED